MTRFGVKVLVWTGVFIVGLMSAVICLDRASCSARWQASGHATRYGVLQGCLVELEPGRWVPEDTFKSVYQVKRP